MTANLKTGEPLSKLQKIRLDRKMSQWQLASAAGINLKNIQWWESKGQLVDATRIAFVLKLCITLNCRLEDILEDDGNIELVRQYNNIKPVNSEGCATDNKSKSKLQTVRLKKEMTMNELISRVSISAGSVYAWDNKTNNIDRARLVSLLELCIALDCRLEDILEDDSNIELVRQYNNIA